MEKQQQVEKLLGDILRLMEFPARLDFKDQTDGSLGVALHFTGEIPAGVTAGKKSYLVDSLQFLLNKCINRPNVERRWISLGVGGFPEPRPPQQQQQQQQQPPQQQAQPAPKVAAPAAAAAARPAAPPKPARAPEVDEAKREVTPDPVIAALGKLLAEKSARLGRAYAVGQLSADDRTRMLVAAKDVKGVTAKAEGQDHLRRLAFVPEKATPMPKRNNAMVYPDDEEEAD